MLSESSLNAGSHAAYLDSETTPTTEGQQSELMLVKLTKMSWPQILAFCYIVT